MNDLHKQAIALENKLKNYLDQPNHAHAKAMLQNIYNLLQDIKQQKNRYSLENRIKSFIVQLEQLVDDTIMDYRHRDELKKHAELIQQNIRSM